MRSSVLIIATSWPETELQTRTTSDFRRCTFKRVIAGEDGGDLPDPNASDQEDQPSQTLPDSVPRPRHESRKAADYTAWY